MPDLCEVFFTLLAVSTCKWATSISLQQWRLPVLEKLIKKPTQVGRRKLFHRDLVFCHSRRVCRPRYPRRTSGQPFRVRRRIAGNAGTLEAKTCGARVRSDRRRTRQRSFLVTQVLTATAIGPKAHFFTKTRQIARGPLGAHGDTGALPLVPSRQRLQFGQP